MRLVEPPDLEVLAANDPLVAVHVEEFLETFEENGLLAERRFVGKLVTVTGPVSTVFRGRGELCVTIAGGRSGSLLCGFPAEAEGDLLALRRGDVLVVEGTVGAGRGVVVKLQRCRVVDVWAAGPGPRAA